MHFTYFISVDHSIELAIDYRNLTKGPNGTKVGFE